MAPDGGQYKTLGDDPSKMLLEEAFQRRRNRLGSSEDAKDDLYALLCSRPSWAWHVNSDGEETRIRLDTEFWKNSADLWVETDDDGVDHIRVRYPDYALGYPHYRLLGGRANFFVLTVDIEREERLYPTAAASPKSPATRQKTESESRRSETAPGRFSAWAAEYKKGLNGANPAMGRFIAFAKIKGHRSELRAAYKELFPEQKPGRPPKNNPPKINPPK